MCVVFQMDAFPPDLLRWAIKHYFHNDALALLRTCKALYYKLGEDEKEQLRIQLFHSAFRGRQFDAVRRSSFNINMSCLVFLQVTDRCECCNLPAPRYRGTPHANYAVCPLSGAVCGGCGRAGVVASFANGLCWRCTKPASHHFWTTVCTVGVVCVLALMYWRRK